MPLLLVEQNASRALTLVRRAYVLESGKVAVRRTSAELADNRQVQTAYLGIDVRHAGPARSGRAIDPPPPT